MPDIRGVQSPSARLRGAQRGQGPSLLMHLVPRDMRWFPRGARHVELNRCTELIERVEIVVVVLDPLAAPNANPGRVTVRYCQPASRHIEPFCPIVSPVSRNSCLLFRCYWCQGAATMPCGECRGTGRDPAKKNHHARNHVNTSRVVGTKWTALERTFGWRHFEVKEVLSIKGDPKKKNSKQTYVLLEATCDGTARLWVDVDILKSRKIWSAGWLQKETLQKLLAEDTVDGDKAHPPCKACGGRKTAPCRYCCSQEPIQLF